MIPNIDDKNLEGLFNLIKDTHTPQNAEPEKRSARAAGLKTKYKYIEFVQGAGKDMKDWTIFNKYNEFLGLLCYNKKWREWELCPEEYTGWTTQCLLDVVDFIKQLKAS